MKPITYDVSLTVRVKSEHREIIEHLAESRRLSLGEATRMLLDYGISALPTIQ